jgi:hypothetical protein
MLREKRFLLKIATLANLALCLILAISVLPLQQTAVADLVIPPVWDIVTDDFESGTLNAWRKSSGGNFNLVSEGGYNGSTGLSVAVGQDSSQLYQTDVAKAEEGYMTFWFSPNGVVIPDEGTSWVPGKSICITAIVNSDDWWPPLVALYVRRPAEQGYQAYLAWPIDAEDSRHYDYESGSFDLVDGWQRITVGYRINEWVAVWHNGELMRHATHPPAWQDQQY